MSTVPSARRAELEPLLRWALGIGGLALVVCVIGAFFDPEQFFRAYLAVYLFILGLPLGSFAVLALYHLTGGAWGFLIRRILEACTRTLPLLVVLFLPIGFGAGYLYPWLHWSPEEVAATPNLRIKQVYLNLPFFWVRAVLFFALWGGFIYFLDAWSRRQDENGDGRLPQRLGRFSAVGLVVYGITLTFAAVDWVMSLQPSFRSTIFGPLVASGQVLSALALAVIVMAWLVARPPVAEVISLEALNDLGNLLLTFLIIWAYMAWFQFMLIWITNLPGEITWYLDRSEGGWEYVQYALAVFQFSVPFFLLLMRDVKRDAPTLAGVAALVLFMQLVCDYYLVMPLGANTHPPRPDTVSLGQHWMDFLTPLGLGGLWLAYFLWELPRRPLLPRHDDNEKSALHYRRLDVEQGQERELEAATRRQESGHA
jgi:hypothetical protein